MGASKPDTGVEPGLETIHETTQRYFRLMGKRIDQMRRERRMSQKEMGRILGLSQQTVFNILIGERRLRLDLVAVLASRTLRAAPSDRSCLRLPPFVD